MVCRLPDGSLLDIAALDMDAYEALTEAGPTAK